MRAASLDRRTALALCLAWLGTSAAIRQDLTPAQQKLLAHATNNDPVWALLAKAAVTEDKDRGVLKAVFPAELQALQGKPLKVAGYMLPMQANPTTNHFAVVRRDPTCPFCPPSAPNEAVEVICDRLFPLLEQEVVASGTLVLLTDSRNGLFFGLAHADLALSARATQASVQR